MGLHIHCHNLRRLLCAFPVAYRLFHIPCLSNLSEKELLFEKLFPENYGETFFTDNYAFHFDVDKFILALKEKCIKFYKDYIQ